MHKSAGNVVSPDALIKRYGAEIIRLWVASEDYRDNIRLSEEILKRLTEAYRRIRNTCRYLLGNLFDFNPETDRIDYKDLEELDQWALNRFQEVNSRVLRAYDEFEFHLVYHGLHNFCVIDLSSFYLDIVKDRLYASAPKSHGRKSAQTVMHEILHGLVRLMAPILSFTSEEVWQTMSSGSMPKSVHMDLFVPLREEYKNPELAERWDVIIGLRKEVTRALEIARKEKRIGHSLDASVSLGLPDHIKTPLHAYRDQLKTLFIVSSVNIISPDDIQDGYVSEEIPGLKIGVMPAAATKCERCWVRDDSVGSHDAYPTICNRCVRALEEGGFISK
jgi:isoleucyl-tRNA synthetase